jgi:transcription elongation GreA/GreB family factor
MDLQTLSHLPAWKSFDVARKERMALLQQRIRDLHSKLVQLQAEAPENTNCGWFSGGNNESFELDRQFTMAKDSIARAERELYQLSQASSARPGDGRAYHGSIVVVVDREELRRALRLVLTSEPEKDAEGVEHVELASPLGSQLLGAEEGAELALGFGPNRKLVEVEAVI